MKTAKTFTLLCAVAIAGSLAAACDKKEKDEDELEGPTPFVTPTADPNAHAFTQDAQVTYPRLIDLQTKVFANTCSPNPNVCHNSSNYPQLTTAGALQATIDSPCNVEIPDRTQGWDNCERKGDIIRAGAGPTLNTRVAYMQRIGPQTWMVGLENAPNTTANLRPEFYAIDENGNQETILNPPVEWGVEIALVANTAHAMVTVASADEFVPEFVDSVLGTVVGGDPNENGIWGADDPASIQPGAVVHPGSLARSYLWGRITGTVPGSRMPLANTPITNGGYVAIACWIEQLGSGEVDPNDLIDYDACQYADAPIDYAVTE